MLGAGGAFLVRASRPRLFAVTPCGLHFRVAAVHESRYLNVAEADMTTKEALLKEIDAVPEPLLDEVLDFIQFLKAKLPTEARNTALASESALRKDWMKPEEDAAWGDL